MHRNHGRFSAARAVILQLVLLTAIALRQGLVAHPGWYKLLYVTLPLLVVTILYIRWKDLRIPSLKRLKPSTINS